METDVVVVGGGVTGVAVLRDLALRGVHAVWLERFDLGTGTSGRWHGLLHSGARYAVRDQESARECIEENTTLRRIAPHTIEDIGGLFVLLPGDDEAYAGQFVEGCRASGIPTEELSAAASHRREPLLAPDVRLSFAVPDGGIDSWSLLRSMAADAEARGCKVLVRHPLVGIERDGDRITAVRVHDAVAGEDRTIGCQWVVNAAGAWAGEVGRMAGVPLTDDRRQGRDGGDGQPVRARGGQRLPQAGRRRHHRAPARGGHPRHHLRAGGRAPTTSRSPPADVDRMIDMCAQMVPAIASGRVLRAFAGSRPLYVAEPRRTAATAGGDTREVSRTFTVLDHPKLDGLDNMYSIVGGKLTTCRQMAEAVVDRLAERMGVTEPCRTATEVLPGADHGTHRVAAPLARVERDQAYGELICECELVTRGQVREAVGLRADRAGGPAPQGPPRLRPLPGRLLRLAGRRHAGRGPRQRVGAAADGGPDAVAGLERFLEERWRGQRSTIWGDQARQALLNHAIYRGIFDLQGEGVPDEAAAPSARAGEG